MSDCPTPPDLYPAPPPGWIGWRRRNGGGRWQQVSQGATEAEAFRALLEVAKRDRSGSYSSVVLREGEKP